MAIDEKSIVDELYEQYPILEEVAFNEFTLADKLAKHSLLLLKYEDLVMRETIRLNQLNLVFEKVQGERYDYYKFNYNRALTAREVEKYYLPKDEQIIETGADIWIQKIRVDFFTLCLKAVEKMGWNMKMFKEVHF